ncbi:hypothetical protein [Methylocystis sp. SB2]|uniref:hypothetical protein n=1 Tax=Methylocystis sp. (strain SB2) TaxID=743836 RepID=UPI00040BBB0E|nr:hypothetical protein [Methylocystis sp. SB2]ULO24043.1 hypothetical protein LNB28_01110 [Methylocystis sp. SB2]
MESKKLATGAAPRKLSDYLTRARDKAPAHVAHSAGGAQSVRKDSYRDHEIEIVTTYAILVDGKKIRAPLGVDASGQVHCHSLPNYQTASAVDMVRALIDGFPEEFERKPAPSKSRPPASHKRRPAPARKSKPAAKKTSKHEH